MPALVVQHQAAGKRLEAQSPGSDATSTVQEGHGDFSLYWRWQGREEKLAVFRAILPSVLLFQPLSSGLSFFQ